MKLSESLKQLGRPVVFYPRLAAIFGIPESIFISHFVYWSDKGEDRDGWIYKSAEEIERETGLTYEQQKRISRVLTGTSGSLTGHHRTNRSLPESILEKRYERTAHRMYFRVDFEALDRVFSQGQLFPTEHWGISPVAVGESPTATGGIPRSSTTESTTESTQIYRAGKSAHKEFVAWWDRMVVKTREINPLWEKSDFRNLKIALEKTDPEKLEQFGLYFLSDPSFRKYQPSLHVFLSHGVFQGLLRAERREGFWGKVDFYVVKHMGGNHDVRVYQRDDMRVLMADLANRFSMVPMGD